MRPQVAVTTLMAIVILTFNLRADDSSELVALHKFAQKIDAQSSDSYGQIHLKWKMKSELATDSEKEESETLYEYWAKDGKYFRVDEQQTLKTAGVTEKDRRRLIVRPEGYITMRAKGSQDFAVTGYGDLKAGHQALEGYLFYEVGSLLTNGVQLSVMTREMIEGKSGWKLTSFSQEGAQSKVKLTLPDKQVEYDILLRNEPPGVISCRCTLGDPKQVFRECVKQYDAKSAAIPAFINESGSIPGKKHKYNVERLHLDTDEIAIGLFSLEAHGINTNVGSVWIRRLGILAAALVCVGLYLSYRWKKSRE